MEQKILEQISTLEAEVSKQNASIKSSLKLTSIIYTVLVIFVATYTIFVMNRIKSIATPETLSAMLTSKIETIIPKQREKIQNQIKARIPEGIDSIIKYSHTALPAIEEKIKVAIDGCVDHIADQFAEDIIPIFSDYLKKEAPEIRKSFKSLKNEDGQHVVADLLLDSISKELDSFLHVKFENTINNLNKDIVKMTKKNLKLTQKEDAERRVLLYWTYLTRVKKVEGTHFKKIMDSLEKAKSNFRPE